MSDPAAPSPLVCAQLEPLRATAGLGPVVDLACGSGRHTLAAAAAGLRTIGFDRDGARLRALQTAGASRGLPISTVRTDLEAGHGIPVHPGSCGAVLVFRFLFRPLAGAIRAALRPGGLLLYETFTVAQLELGWGPRRPAFLLQPGELRSLFQELEILYAWEGITRREPPEAIARLVARKPAARRPGRPSRGEGPAGGAIAGGRTGPR